MKIEKGTKFRDIQKQVNDSIESKWDKLGINESVTMIDTFFYIHGNTEYSSSALETNRYIPCVVLVGDETGRVYTFSLLFLVPDLLSHLRE